MRFVKKLMTSTFCRLVYLLSVEVCSAAGVRCVLVWDDVDDVDVRLWQER